ncbi:uncharacterized protein N7483_012653 [Penicillium malachiteum]|uniref:uncharacterized protein n=1 Tax=Penicillium malachiteum TaxID=1324776 RepID=UPI002548FCAC|nr:uncharacterized protein N7483_012653 [Penicillium malachiteum]KAJ5715472.1 hypothetical protein N7483_012653 [Penicillium malachiteum]
MAHAHPGSSSDTLIAPPSPVHTTTHKPSTLMESDLELYPLESESPAPIPKLFREASDITWQESLESSQEQVPLVRRRGLHRYRLVHQQQFKNSLLASVGYLELANAGDFAANVWNDIPVPTFAAVLMGIGGTLALAMTWVAVQDFRLSWRNVRLLREEREHLMRLKAYHSHNYSHDHSRTCNEGTPTRNEELTRVLDSRLGVGMREIGTEVVDRIVMDLLMGAGSVLVGVGTLMAIGGANPRVYKASNLLSGYIGNALAALFGIANAIWSIYLIRRFRMYDRAVLSQEPSDDIRRRLRLRFKRFQWHSLVNCLNGLVAGAASMVTAKWWEGYVVLIPCIISLIMCNHFWRQKLGYDRPILDHVSLAKLQLTPLIEDLEYVIAMQRVLGELDSQLHPDRELDHTTQPIVRADSLDSMLRFIVRNHMLETYVDDLAHDKTTRSILSEIPSTDSTTTNGPETIVTLDVLLRLSQAKQSHAQLLLNHARRFLSTEGVRIFTHRERHLLELLGYAVWQDQTASTVAPPTLAKDTIECK